MVGEAALWSVCVALVAVAGRRCTNISIYDHTIISRVRVRVRVRVRARARAGFRVRDRGRVRVRAGVRARARV